MDASPLAVEDCSKPTASDLEAVFRLKYGDPDQAGWRARMRVRFGYFTPDDHYEAIVDRLIVPGCTWVDVGCGRDVFPSNSRLAEVLSGRCKLLVGVDPDSTLEENTIVHQRSRSPIESFEGGCLFDVATLRMVAEHVTNPEATVASLARLTRPGSKVVIYTVNRWSPVSILASLIPFPLHHPIKRFFWRTEERDTFPLTYAMNTRGMLKRHFERNGFQEVAFAYLDGCRAFGRFRPLQFLELTIWRLFRHFGSTYPENCLLGVYERVDP